MTSVRSDIDVDFVRSNIDVVVKIVSAIDDEIDKKNN